MTDRTALSAAPALIAQAVAGVRVRGEQDDMLRLEAKLPGFGGWYIDSLDQVVVYMKPPSGIPPTVVRATIYHWYAARPEASVRRIMAPADHARIVDGAYTLSELIAIENRIASPRILIPGFVGVGTSLFLNRVTVGFRDTASVCPGVTAITSMGVPTQAIIPEVWGEFRLAVASDSSALNALTRIGADSSRSVRLASRKTGRLDGQRFSLVGDSVLLDTYSGMRAIAVVDVDSVWVQRGTAAVLVGFITGLPCALFGAMVGDFIGGDPDSKGSPGRAAVLTLVGFLGGGLVCGSVGAGIGSLIRRWELEYPRS